MDLVFGALNRFSSIFGTFLTEAGVADMGVFGQLLVKQPLLLPLVAGLLVFLLLFFLIKMSQRRKGKAIKQTSTVEPALGIMPSSQAPDKKAAKTGHKSGTPAQAATNNDGTDPLQIIARDMAALKELHETGHIKESVYVEETASLYAMAQRLKQAGLR